MTTGALIYAQNNSSVDYVKLAVFAAKQVKKYLDIPISIVTDSPGWLEESQPDHVFDQIINFVPTNTDYHQRRFNDGALSSRILEWKNLERATAYELSPYDRTLVLDSDYIVNSTILKNALLVDSEFQIYKNCFDISGWRTNNAYKRINPYSIPFYWATVFVFDKTPMTKAFFDLIMYIRQNWNYFRTLYNIEFPTFRNDFAFSIAIHNMNGKSDGIFASELPGSMNYITDRDFLISIDDNDMKFLIEKENWLGEYTLAKVQNLDVHVMNKYSLARFIDGGSGV